MRIERREDIIVTEKEAELWEKFSKLLEAIEKESTNSDVLDHVSEIMAHMSDLWEEIEDVE